MRKESATIRKCHSRLSSLGLDSTVAFHKSKLILKIYRDVVWVLSERAQELQEYAWELGDQDLSIERHTRTLDEKDIRNGKVLYSDLDTDELLGEDMIPDMTSERVEDSAIYSILREKLHQYLGMLPPQDMELIQALYFECMTEREYAQQIGISQKGVNKRRQKVLDKLRTMMKAK